MAFFITVLSSIFLWSAPQRMEIDSQFFMAGEKVAAPRIVTLSGKRAKIFMNDVKRGREYNFEVHPRLAANDQVSLNYAIAVKDQDNETISRGMLVLDKKQNARISLDKGNIEVLLKLNM